MFKPDRVTQYFRCTYLVQHYNTHNAMPSYLTQSSTYPANTHFPKLSTYSSIKQERSQPGGAQTSVTSTTNAGAYLMWTLM